MDPAAITVVSLVIGLTAGVVGGLAGIGGSIIMLPALGVFVGYQTPDKSEQHVYQAAAMCVNVVVAWSSSLKHREAGVHDPVLSRNILPGMILGMVAGVLLSEQLKGVWLKYGLVAFLWVYCAYNTGSVVFGHRKGGTPTPGALDVAAGNTMRLRVIGGLTGVPSGILGIGGGLVMIPLMQVWAKIPLKKAIAASASVMWVSALVGAGLKVYGLGGHAGVDRLDVLWLAGPMSLGAFVGSSIGAGLTHRLRVPHLKLAISAVLAVAGLRLVGAV